MSIFDDNPDCYRKKTYTAWSVVGDKWYPIEATRPFQDPGFYDIKIENYGSMYFKKNDIISDQIIRFSDSIMDTILEEIDTFWRKEDIFHENGFLHKKGILLASGPGEGKSCLIKLIMQELIKLNGIILNCGNNPEYSIDGLRIIRSIDEKRPIICLFEDIDEVIKKYGENALLSLLDGENSFENILFLATTNKPDQLSSRIKNRPRRFDRLYVLTPPNDSIREKFFREKLNPDLEILKEYVKKTKGLSFADMVEVIISIQCFGYTFDESLEMLHNHCRATTLSEKDFSKNNDQIGFKIKGE
jgi:hypothetical protein